MTDLDYEHLVAALRSAIARRDGASRGTPAHWRASCEARALMKRVAVAAGRRHGPWPASGEGAMDPRAHAPGRHVGERPVAH